MVTRWSVIRLLNTFRRRLRNRPQMDTSTSSTAEKRSLTQAEAPATTSDDEDDRDDWKRRRCDSPRQRAADSPEDIIVTEPDEAVSVPPVANTKSGKQPTKFYQNQRRTLFDELYLASYYFENGLRKVRPYPYEWTTFAKKRWLGRSIGEVFRAEFVSGSAAREIALARIDAWRVLVNGRAIEQTYQLVSNDFIQHKMHRHEAPVSARALSPFVFEDEHYLVVDKPPSIPVHPCGRYMFNSLIAILAAQYSVSGLCSVHRLDRLTSGLVIFGKSPEKARALHEQMQAHTITKEYLCCVAGNFPDGTIVCSKPIACADAKFGYYVVDDESDSAKEAVTEFEKVSSDGATSILRCRPRTGRTHQIRVHLLHLGYPVVNDPVYGASGKRGGVDIEMEWLSPNALAVAQRDADFDRACPECRVRFRDPKPEQMEIYLHAHRYSGPGWQFETSRLPHWAENRC